MAEKETMLKIKSLRKEYPGVVAVNDVSFDIKKGEVHIVIGENGAGKSTLVKMMAGLEAIDGGTLELEGKPYKPTNVLEAQASGVNIIHQELSMMENRTVAQNVFIGREPKKGFLVNNNEMNRKCKALMDSLEIDIDPSTKVQDLSIAQQQMVEVAKALSFDNSKILIMDEPTSSLTTKEIENLFRITRKLKSEGVSIIYISHRMQELMEIGDRVTVMRDGSYVGTRNICDIDMQELIMMMVGRKIENAYPRTYNEPGKEVLKTENLTGLRFRNINIEIKAGEIIGVAGLVGAGRTELAKAIFGYDPIDSGKVIFNGEQINNRGYSTSKSVDANMALLPEDRKKEGLFLDMSIADNISQAVAKKVFKNGLVKKSVENEMSNKYIKELAIATTSGEKFVKELSGGNQQKVVLGKWLATESNFLVFDEPTRGIDVGAKYEIYSIMNKLAKDGAAIMMISSDLPELLGVSDRVYIMRDGEVAGEVNKDEGIFTQEGILDIALHGKEEA
ncbi:MAG: sugar ABC transporter ATP-binding protein [Suipraeoptans sp.]